MARSQVNIFGNVRSATAIEAVPGETRCHISPMALVGLTREGLKTFPCAQAVAGRAADFA